MGGRIQRFTQFHLFGVVVADHDAVGEAPEIRSDQVVQWILSAKGGDRHEGWKVDGAVRRHQLLSGHRDARLFCMRAGLPALLTEVLIGGSR